VNGYFFALNFGDVYEETAKAKKLFDAGVNIGFRKSAGNPPYFNGEMKGRKGDYA